MAIPESQLETWSHQGSVAQSAQTYEILRNALNDSASPFYSKDFTIFLQGSYGNDTNIYRDSDVDVVIRLNQTYYSDTSWLNPGAKENYDRAFSRATYDYGDFKADVMTWLRKQFGDDMKIGKKAIFIAARGNRRDTDVLVCARHRRYRAASIGVDDSYDEGIVFWSSDGIETVNYPKQHSENCTTKHQNSGQQFKRTVRIYKNMRNRMIEDKYITAGLAPSYFIEGMLWNVPANLFVKNYVNSFVNTFNWVVNADKTKLACANDLHWLVRDNTNVCWSSADFDAYLTAMQRYWAEWKM